QQQQQPGGMQVSEYRLVEARERARLFPAGLPPHASSSATEPGAAATFAAEQQQQQHQQQQQQQEAARPSGSGVVPRGPMHDFQLSEEDLRRIERIARIMQEDLRS